ncbi:hypothetical protein FGL97_01380 [Pseudomonas putida]|jgi:hypothetical protein|uniref:hypothetical protein n=1 Tax=Pseudomonas putida TaxID=303 RepID=UPI00159D223B|nr:hypothetical protein [Pseudomonas putida]NVN61902.1 hypothetical protein [Pseudomonas putida]NVN66895.1 hypothetical protein [Pseudomonas putida]
MATQKAAAAASEAPVAVDPQRVLYRDAAFRSRSIFTPTGAQFDVVNFEVRVPASDDEALATFDDHPDFQRVQE